jgi:hypothetical protein
MTDGLRLSTNKTARLAYSSFIYLKINNIYSKPARDFTIARPSAAATAGTIVSFMPKK